MSGDKTSAVTGDEENKERKIDSNFKTLRNEGHVETRIVEINYSRLPST